MQAKDISYQRVADYLNRYFHRETTNKQFNRNSLQYHVESTGRKLESCIKEKSEEILKSFDVDSQTGIIDKENIPNNIVLPELPNKRQSRAIGQQIKEYNEGKDSRFQIKDKQKIKSTESPQDPCCLIFIDDVGAKHQKETRKNNLQGTRNTRKTVYVENTVIYISCGNLHYTLTQVGMAGAFKQLVAFLLHNQIIQTKKLIFITDGATCIKNNIEKFFGFTKYELFLDWFHLEKRSYEMLSMAIDRKQDTEETVFATLKSILWAGNTEDAIKYMTELPDNYIKNKKRRQEIIDYLNRKSPYIACYALRSMLNLRISSNRVEKENDLIVARRQKNNGMAWSIEGSGALAAISALDNNGELKYWLKSRTVRFQMAA